MAGPLAAAVSTATLSLTDFLLARIAEDEELAREAVDPHLSGGGYGLVLGTRVLAECAAKRRIVELHGGEHVCWQPDYPVDGDFGETNCWGDCATMRYLAAVYADHPDYPGLPDLSDGT